MSAGTVVAYLLVIAFLILATLFLLYTVYLFYLHHKYSHLPSPKMTSFYLGHLPDIIRLRKEKPHLPLQDICEYWMQDAGSRIIVVFIFHNVQIYIADPEVIKAIVMDTKNDKAKIFNQAFNTLYGERYLGNGIVTVVDHKSWKPKRKTYDPAFKKSYLKELIPSFNSIVDNFLEKLKPLADGKTVVSMRDHIRSFTLEVVSKMIFDSDFTKLEFSNITVPPEYSNVFAYINEKALIAANEQLNSLYPPWMHYFHPLKAKDYQEAVKAFREIGKNCIVKRIKAIENGESRKDLLTLILKTALEGTINLEDMVDDFCTFYVGGYDTSSSLLLFSIILVHQHPDVLSRLQEEVAEVLGDKREVSAEDIEKLNYMHQVLNKTLRMYPPVAALLKSLHADLTVGDTFIPAHTDCLLINSVMCSMPEYFENPDIFNPDNFAPGMKPNSFVFFPFGLGHRACIGKQFALMESKIILARLLQTYNLTLPDDYELKQEQKVFLQPKGDIPCTLCPIINN